MAYSLNKVWTAMAASLVAATSLVSAGYYDQQNCGQCCPTQCGSLKPALDGCGSWFFSADALYWKAQEDGLAYGTVIETATAGTGGTITDIEVLNPKTRWDWGFRLGLGYDFSCGWDLRAYWTHYRTNAHGHFDANTFVTTTGAVTTETLAPTFGTNFGPGGSVAGTPAIDELRSHWRLRLDLADVELGREFCIGPCVSVRPHVGIRAVWLKQRYRIEALAPTVIGGTTFFDSKFDRLRSDFEGVGLRTGFDTQWNVGCGFSVYGNAAASLVYGHFHNRILEEDVTVTAGPTTTDLLFEQHDSYHACRFIADAGLGLRYQQAFCCDTVILTLQVGWEQHLFVDQNRFEDFANNTTLVGGTTGNVVNAKNPGLSRGDLCVRGWTFGLKLDF